jgi:hypothetical protein
MVEELILTIWWILSDTCSSVSLSAGLFNTLHHAQTAIELGPAVICLYFVKNLLTFLALVLP